MSPIQVTRYLSWALIAMFGLMFASDLIGDSNFIKEYLFHFVILSLIVIAYALWAFNICTDPSVVLPRRYDERGRVIRHQ